MIIGAQKAGTTSLKNYLGEHPQIVTHPHTECSFFASDDEYNEGFEKGFVRYFGGEKDFQDKVIVGKNVTISFREFALKRLAQHNPNCKIVFILRNPTKRAYSAYQMAVRGGWMENPFSYANEAIEKNKRQEYDKFYRFIIDLGIYANQIETLFQYFPKEQIEFVIYEEFKNDPLSTCKSIFKKLDIKSDFEPATNKVHNSGGAERSKSFGKVLKSLSQSDNSIKKLIRGILPEKTFVQVAQKVKSFNAKKEEYAPPPLETINLLNQYYKPFNTRCAQMIGKDLDAWEIS